ncbi:acetoacetate decarboxylase family protein [Solidesulfovibrio carbinolicus]|uniref:Acetoacetate decarboxylase n=1 Tax=Solidesulfovibrio carbinolicus TaxID=296842 RepID=A0A4P6HNS8_9BACT|nr:acetoacetate decarboxylase family protein [Solidesulfovibrio carbinolicus]QAZ68725.1 acetoacetate decarboxylase [Solidesulfovibrio carbinolicus]
MENAFASFTAPFTASGRAALVPPPPWHYAGWLLNVAIACDTSASASLVPPALGRLTGCGCIHFADWQATTDGRELLDPVYAQYRETIVIVEIELPDGSLANFCPFIWVDQDISLIRGLLQGWPKKFGATSMTRSLPIDHLAAAPLQAGTKLGASLCVKDRRLVEAALELTGNPGRPLGFLANRTIGSVGWPDLTRPGEPPHLRWLLPDIRDKVASQWHEATAQVRTFEHPVEELSLLGTLQAQTASVGWIGITVAGAREAAL